MNRERRSHSTEDSWLRLGALIDLSHNHSASFFFFGFSFFVKECGSLFVQLWGLNFVCAYQKAFFWIKIKLIKLQALGLRFRFRLALGSVLGSGLCFGIPAKRVQLKSCNKIVFNLIWPRRQPEPFSRLLSFYALLTRHLPCSSLY